MVESSNILLETGTNELEVLEFTIAGNSFGINVAKVKTLMQIQPPQPMPNSHPCIEGVFQPRDEVFPIVNLAMYLGLPASELPEKDMYIITNFNEIQVAFHVHSVEIIHRISWTSIEKPDPLIYGGDDGVVTGIAKINGRIISILDFEKITFDISPSTGIDLKTVMRNSSESRAQCPILIAEDSALLRKLILDALRTAGYTSTMVATNGLEAWNILKDYKELNDGHILDHVKVVITDIEMPQMDGLHFCKQIKDDPILHELPVIFFSSLIDDTMKNKGLEVGADAMLSKPEIARLVGVIEDIIDRGDDN